MSDLEQRILGLSPKGWSRLAQGWAVIMFSHCPAPISMRYQVVVPKDGAVMQAGS